MTRKKETPTQSPRQVMMNAMITPEQFAHITDELQIEPTDKQLKSGATKPYYTRTQLRKIMKYARENHLQAELALSHVNFQVEVEYMPGGFASITSTSAASVHKDPTAHYEGDPVIVHIDKAPDVVFTAFVTVKNDPQGGSIQSLIEQLAYDMYGELLRKQVSESLTGEN